MSDTEQQPSSEYHNSHGPDQSTSNEYTSSTNHTHQQQQSNTKASRSRSPQRHNDSNEHRHDAMSDHAAPPRNRDVNNEIIESRFIVPSSLCGGIIGKGGDTITIIRDKSGCQITLLRTGQSDIKHRPPPDMYDSRLVQERIMHLKGTIQQNALCLKIVYETIAHLMDHIPPVQSSIESSTDISSISTPIISIDWLLHEKLIGSIIGKSGQRIKDTCESTGAKIRVNSDLLPHSSEKIINIKGTLDQIYNAMIILLQQSTEQYMDRPVVNVPYVPLPPPSSRPAYDDRYAGYGRADERDIRSYRERDRYEDRTYRADYRDRDYRRDRSPVRPSGETRNAFDDVRDIRGRDRRDISPTRSYNPAASNPDDIVQNIIVPSAAAGGIIGRRGAMIQELRRRVQCRVNIMDSVPGRPDERTIVISGTRKQVDYAIDEIKRSVDEFEASRYMERR